MLYLLAILLPPVAVLFCGKPIKALVCLPLTVLFWLPGVICALVVVHGYHADTRSRRQVKAVGREFRGALRENQANQAAAGR